MFSVTPPCLSAEVGAELLGPLVDRPPAVADAGPPGQRLVLVVARDPERVRPGVGGRVVDPRQVPRAQPEILVDTRDVPEPVEFGGPGGQEAQHRVPAAGIARGVGLHVVVDRAAPDHAQRHDLGPGVIGRPGALGRRHRGEDLQVAGLAAAGRLPALEDGDQPPAKDRHGPDPAPGEGRLGTGAVLPAHVDPDGVVGRSAPRPHDGERRSGAGIEREPLVAGRAGPRRVADRGRWLGRHRPAGGSGRTVRTVRARRRPAGGSGEGGGT